MKREEDQTIWWEHRSFDGLERNCCTRFSLGRNGVTKDEFMQILGEQFGDRRFVAALGEFITRHGGVLQSYWNLHAWNRKEALFLSSVSRYLGLSTVFTSDLEYFALLSSVGY